MHLSSEFKKYIGMVIILDSKLIFLNSILKMLAFIKEHWYVIEVLTEVFHITIATLFRHN